LFQLRALAAVTAVAALAVPAGTASPASPAKSDREITVMTRNLYLGTDLTPIFSAPSLPALFAAAGAAWGQAQANDFPARAQAIADEIADSEPDLVGLQEAMLYRTDVPADGPATPAETVAYDFVEILVTALAQRGLDYEPVSVFTGTDAELPAGLPPTSDVRLTDRVVVLAHAPDKWGGLRVSNPQSGAYPTALTVNTAAGPLRLPRGWASVDVEVRGRSFRFVTTHLDAFSSQIRNAQAAQLLTGPAATELPVILVADTNSGPGTDLGAYGILSGGGFADAWVDGPITCCFKNDLHDPDPTLTKRVDLVLTTGGFEPEALDIVGEDPADRTASGLWPSDHAGVVATLRIPEKPEKPEKSKPPKPDKP
jgi:endonuclease/exonuclease/phosphatase family metal-dependent hydrolase